MNHNPIALLAAGLQTQRPELLEVFRKQMEARKSFTTSEAMSMVQVIINLAEEAYDLRRTVDALNEQQGHIYRALGGCQRQLSVAKEIVVRGRKGTLPHHHDAESIISEVKEEINESDWRSACY